MRCWFLKPKVELPPQCTPASIVDRSDLEHLDPKGKQFASGLGAVKKVSEGVHNRNGLEDSSPSRVLVCRRLRKISNLVDTCLGHLLHGDSGTRACGNRTVKIKFQQSCVFMPGCFLLISVDCSSFIFSS